MKSQRTDPLSFERSSYRTQVFRLRELAKIALQSFSIKVNLIQLVNYGENAAFKITAKNGDRFLLRIHRSDYHSIQGLKEELQWLKLLVKKGIPVPHPVSNKWGKDIVIVSHPRIGLRACDMFKWIDGRFLSKSISEADMFKIGVLLAKIQQAGHKTKCKHRQYWTSDGLVGANPKFGSIDGLPCLRKNDQIKLTKIRKEILSKLKYYAKSYPQKMGLIHADLHFGNLLKAKGGQLAAIDFDDCGYGFYVYDLAIPLVALERHLQLYQQFHLYPLLKHALLAGYASLSKLTENDLAILQVLIVARRLVIIGWLKSRSDNPKVSGHLKNYAEKTLRYVAKPYL